MPEPTAAYVHVPFCEHRCGYCDFPLVAGRDDLIDDYLSALEKELATLGEPREVETLFLGGGTPTHLAAEQLARLLKLVRQWFFLADGYEFSVEANPAGFTVEKMDVLAEAGVNRVSLGVQSFDPEILVALERDHRRDAVGHVVSRLKERFENISFDLIFGVPGQSLESWEATLRQAVGLRPEHISTYGLTFEKGTAFWNRREKGELVPLDEELERSMYAAAMESLPAAGLEQYELSSFARPGRECRHNQVYWQAAGYFGFGPGAARYTRGRRETNHRSVTTWLKRISRGESPVAEADELTPEERAREAVVLGLRQCAGIAPYAFQQRTGYDLEELAGEIIAAHCRNGLLERAEGRIRLTREGRFLADSVMVDFL